MLMDAFDMADRWGEPDPRKILNLPADIFQHWQAYFSLKTPRTDSDDKLPASDNSLGGAGREKTDDELFMDNLRIIGHG